MNKSHDGYLEDSKGDDTCPTCFLKQRNMFYSRCLFASDTIFKMKVLRPRWCVDLPKISVPCSANYSSSFSKTSPSMPLTCFNLLRSRFKPQPNASPPLPRKCLFVLGIQRRASPKEHRPTTIHLFLLPKILTLWSKLSSVLPQSKLLCDQCNPDPGNTSH